jgi:hypothetical protein
VTRLALRAVEPTHLFAPAAPSPGMPTERRRVPRPQAELTQR